MSDIFARQREKDALGLLTNGRVLSQDHLPTSMKDVVGRKNEKEKILDYLFKAIKYKERFDLNIVGTSGLGKTYLLKAILSDVRKEKEYAEKFYASFVNCKGFHPPTKFKLHNAILAPLGREVGKGKGDRDTTIEFNRLVSERPVIVVLDEVDEIASLPGDHLYNLIELGLSLIMVSNKFNWHEKVDPQISSRAQADKVEFPPYSEEETYNVFEYIRMKSLKPGVMNDEILRIVTKHTIDDFLGDIRRGKNLISLAVNIAQNEGSDIVTINHVEQALIDVKSRTLAQNLTNFIPQELIALASIVSVQKDMWDHARGKLPEPTSGKVYEMFLKNIDANKGKIVSETRMQQYLKHLEASEIIWHKTRSHISRGRVNYWYLTEDYTVEDYYLALIENGVTPWTVKSAKEFFK